MTEALIFDKLRSKLHKLELHCVLSVSDKVLSTADKGSES